MTSDRIEHTDKDIVFNQLGDTLFTVVVAVGIAPKGEIFLYDQGGYIMRRNEWERLRERIDAFHDQYTDADIDADERESERQRQARLEAERAAYAREKESHRKAMPGFVYLIRCGEFYKIGRAKKWEARIARFETIYPHDLEVIHVARCDDMIAEEESLHKAYADRRDKGEWFRLGDDDIVAITSALPERVAP